jgi:catechol 2,3-dioxygenase-like lactoylglutathione lyase family enzyme
MNREKVEGIGGVFFRAHDPLRLAHWYRDTLGIDSGLDGETVWTQKAGPAILAPFPLDNEKFDQRQGVMLNFRVGNLVAMVEQLRAEGISTEGEIVTEAGVGRFAWIRDPEANLVELWEPETA